jgi:plasmid stabilization system protein ParE
MANKYALRHLPAAVDDLVLIFDWIANDSSANAAAFVERLDKRIGNLKTYPSLCHIPRDEKLKNSGYRILVTDAYFVFYMIRGKTDILYPTISQHLAENE